MDKNKNRMENKEQNGGTIMFRSIIKTILRILGAINIFRNPSKEEIKNMFAPYKDTDEEILGTEQTTRVKYDARRFIDSNSFFCAWIILTTKRIVIVKNKTSYGTFSPPISVEMLKNDKEKTITYEPERIILDFPSAGRTYTFYFENSASYHSHDAIQEIIEMYTK